MKLGEHESDLRWFFTLARGELGLRSNFNSIVARLEGGDGGSGTPHHIDDRRLEAAARARRVSSALALLTKGQRDVLVAAYCRDDTRLLWVMALTGEALDAHHQSRTVRSLLDWLRRLCFSVKSPHEFERRRTFARIHSAADRSLQGALDAYSSHARRLFSARAG